MNTRGDLWISIIRNRSFVLFSIPMSPTYLTRLPRNKKQMIRQTKWYFAKSVHTWTLKNLTLSPIRSYCAMENCCAKQRKIVDYVSWCFIMLILNFFLEFFLLPSPRFSRLTDFRLMAYVSWIRLGNLSTSNVITWRRTTLCSNIHHNW